MRRRRDLGRPRLAGAGPLVTHVTTGPPEECWVLEPTSPWGDYGRILVHGMSRHRERVDGRIQLERVGPEIAPITLPGLGDLIATDAARAELEAAALPGLAFRAVDPVHVPRLDWSSWDRTAARPPTLPTSGEPEDFVLAATHDATAAEALGRLWEVELPERGRYAAARAPDGGPSHHLDLGSEEPLPIFRGVGHRRVIVSQRFRERHAALLVACELRPVLLGTIPEGTGGRPRRVLALDEPIPPGFYVKSRIHDPFDGTTKNLIAKKPWWRFW